MKSRSQLKREGIQRGESLDEITEQWRLRCLKCEAGVAHPFHDWGSINPDWIMEQVDTVDIER